MWRDIGLPFVRVSLSFFAMAAGARAGAGGGESQLPLTYSESVSVIQTAQCPLEPNHRNEYILSVYLRQGQRELEYITAQGSLSPCPHVNHTVLKLACRGRLRAPHNRYLLVVALEPSVSLSLEDSTLNCLIGSLKGTYSSYTTVPAMVRSYQALKRSWTVKKLNLTSDFVLEIEVMDERMGWRSIRSEGGWTSSHRRATRSVQFYNSTAESDDMTILKVVDTADVFSLTVLVSQNSPLPADSDKWRYTVKVGDVVKDSQRASSDQTRLPSCKIIGTTDLAGIAVPWLVLIGVAVLALILLVCWLIFRCRKNKASDRASHLPLEANHYEMPVTKAAVDHGEDHEESHNQDYDAVENSVRIRLTDSSDTGQ